MSDDKLLTAMDNLKDSIDSLTTINRDVFNVDTSHDDMVSLKGKMGEVIASNKELKEAIGFLNAAINNLTDAIKKQ